MNIIDRIKAHFRPLQYSISLRSDYTTIMAGEEEVVYAPSVVGSGCDSSYKHPIKCGVVADFYATAEMMRNLTHRLPLSHKSSIRLAISPYSYGIEFRALYDVFQRNLAFEDVYVLPEPVAAYQWLEHTYNLKGNILLIDVCSDTTWISIVSKCEVKVCSEMHFGLNALNDGIEEWYASMLRRVQHFIEQTGAYYERAFLISSDKYAKQELRELSNRFPFEVGLPPEFHLVSCKGLEMAWDYLFDYYHPSKFNYDTRMPVIESLSINDREDDRILRKDMEHRQYRSNFIPYSLRNRLKIIAVNGGAIKALAHYYEHHKGMIGEYADCVGMTHNALQDINVPNKIKIDVNLPCCNAYKNSELTTIFDAVVGDSTEVVVIIYTAGSHKHTGNLPDMFAQYLHSKGIETILLTTYPYIFESSKRYYNAVKYIKKLSVYCDETIVIDAQRLLTLPENKNVTFMDVYNLLDKTITKKIDAIIAPYIERTTTDNSDRHKDLKVINLSPENYKEYLPLKIVAIAVSPYNSQYVVLTEDELLYYIDFSWGFNLATYEEIFPKKLTDALETIYLGNGIDMLVHDKSDVWQTIKKVFDNADNYSNRWKEFLLQTYLQRWGQYQKSK